MSSNTYNDVTTKPNLCSGTIRQLCWNRNPLETGSSSATITALLLVDIPVHSLLIFKVAGHGGVVWAAFFHSALLPLLLQLVLMHC